MMAGLATALGFAGCDKDVGAAGPARLSDEQLAALRAEVKRSLATELRPEVIAELKRELAPEVRAQLRAERPPESRPLDAGAPAGPTAPAAPLEPGDAPPTNPDVGPGDPTAPGGPPGGDAPGADVWSQPGTRIWPSAGGLKLVELVVGTSLEEKLPTDVRLHYPNVPEILYCYTVFENPLPDATVTHVWRRGSRLVSRVELEVGNSPKWRTWSKQRTQPHWTGLWSCEVLGDDGRQLGLTVFQIGG